MRNFGSPFSLCLFEPADASSEVLDKALRVYRENTSPLLATRSNQIRAKVAAPIKGNSTFYFCALLRSKTPVGFAMFGHYPTSRLVVFDHLVVDRPCRGENAFYAFAQLLRQAVSKLCLEFDFAVVELEKGNAYGGTQTGGAALARLLSHVGFSEVHTDYRIADLEPGKAPEGHPGILMLSGAEKIHRMRKNDLLAIHRGVLFDHYLPWCESFLGSRTPVYRRELEALHSSLEKQLLDEVFINGPEEDGLLMPSIDDERLSVRPGLRHMLGYIALVTVTTVAAFTLKIGASEIALLLIAVLAAYAGVDLIGSGKADFVFDRAISRLSVGTHKLPSQRRIEGQGVVQKRGRNARIGSRDMGRQ